MPNSLPGVKKILDVFETEQHHERSPYFFIRDTDIPTESLSNNGKGSPVAYTGMTWSGFRPSDDACTYHYLVPSNMFAAVVMGYLERIFGGEILDDADIAARAGELRRTITEGIEAHAKTTNRNGETIYAFETDGLGHVNIMDDSNVPSLMAAPYLGYCTPTIRRIWRPDVRCSATKTRTITRASISRASAHRTPRRAMCGRSRCLSRR